MKLLNLLFFLFLFSILSTSCKDDLPPVLDGNWALTDYDYTLETTKDSFNLTTLITSTGTANNITLELSFSENQNLFNSSGSYDLSSTFNEGGITYPRTYEDVNFGFDGATLENTDTTITLTQNNNVLEFDIIQLTESTLKFHYNLDWTYFDTNTNINYHEKFNANYTLTRLE